MINNIYKLIHNKYLKFFKLFLFLRYIFLIFFIAISVYLSVPKFFDYEKKRDIIQNILIENYNLNLTKYNSIRFNIFPLPNLIINNTNLKFKNTPVSINSKQLQIFLNIQDLYDYKLSSVKKIKIINNKTKIEIQNSADFFVLFNKLDKKFAIKNLDLTLSQNQKSILNLKKISFFNYGYNKNKIEGFIFDKKFKAQIHNQDKRLDFKILETGINAKFIFNNLKESDSILVNSKINILKNYLKLNFEVFKNHIEIKDSNLRNQNLSVSFNSYVKINPYFELNNKFKINKVDKQFIENLKFRDILLNTTILKKLNSKNQILIDQKSFRKQLLNIDFLNLNLVNGILEFSNKNFISGGTTNCAGESFITDEFPRLIFNCTFSLIDKNKFLRTYSIKKKFNKEPIKINIIGSINLFNNKINFKKISTDTNYEASEEDINFYKETFENILLSEGFFKMLRKEKIKDFLLEII